MLTFSTTAVAAAALLSPSLAFAPSKLHRSHRVSSLHSSSSGSSGSSNDDENNFYNDFEDVELSQSSSSLFTNQIGPSSSSSRPRPPLSNSASASTPTDDPSFFASLQKRQDQIRKSSQELLQQWTTGSAKTFAAFTINEQFYKQQEEQAQQGGGGGGYLPPSPYSMSSSYSSQDEEELPFDWVRRVNIGTYPRVACGSAHGSIFVADVEAKCLLGVARNVHSSNHNDNVDALDEKLRQYLYGDYDGGGVLAVAMQQGSSATSSINLVASSGREGGVKLFRLDADEGELKFVGDVPSLKRPLPGVTPILVTTLEFDSLGRLFMGGQDGFLRMVTFSNDVSEFDMKVTLLSSPRQQLQQSPSPILSLDICEELDMVATAHANGNVCVYSTNPDDIGDDRLLGVWNPFSDTNNACHARSVKFISSSGGDGSSNDQGTKDQIWNIVVGGGNGMLWMHEIHPQYIGHDVVDDASFSKDSLQSNDERVSLFKENSMQQIKPSHQGPVLSLASRPGGILVSAGHDGMLRVTQIWPTPKALYGLGGYKVWIGNICIDSEGKRLLSDGRDDVVVVHDFSKEEDEVGGE